MLSRSDMYAALAYLVPNAKFSFWPNDGSRDNVDMGTVSPNPITRLGYSVNWDTNNQTQLPTTTQIQAVDLVAARAALLASAPPVYVNMLQRVSATVTTALSTNVIIPVDNTIPQASEGAQVLILAVTPKSASSKLVASITICATTSLGGNASGALFTDSNVNAISSVSLNDDVTFFNGEIITGSTNQVVFKVRIGPANGLTSTTFNGSGGTQLYGGTSMSRISVTEFTS